MSGSVDMNNRPMLWALVNGAGGTVSQQAGPTGLSIVRVGAGVYTCTLTGTGVDADFCSLKTQIRGGAAQANLQANWTSDTNINVTGFVAGVAADLNFELVIENKRAAQG